MTHYPPKKRGEKYTAPKEDQARYPDRTAPSVSEAAGSRSQMERMGKGEGFAAGEAAPRDGVYVCSHCGAEMQVGAGRVVAKCPSCGHSTVFFLLQEPG